MNTDFSKLNKQMFDKRGRVRMAKQIFNLLSNYYSDKDRNKLKNFTVLDLGCSTGIISNFMSSKFKVITGVDNDPTAIKFAKENFKKNNLKFLEMDGSKTTFKNEQFDLIICNQIYTCVDNPKRLFNEIHRLLKPGGVCLVSGFNKYWPKKPEVDWNVKYQSYWELKRLSRKFEIIPQTNQIVKLRYKLPITIPSFIWNLIEPASPNFVWLIVKPL